MYIISKIQAMELIKSGRAEEVKATKHKYYRMGTMFKPGTSKEVKEVVKKKAKEWKNKRFKSTRVEPYK